MAQVKNVAKQPRELDDGTTLLPGATRTGVGVTWPHIAALIASGELQVIDNNSPNPATPPGGVAIQSGAGAPTGVPAVMSGTVPFYYDTTNHKIWVYDGGWKGVVVA